MNLQAEVKLPPAISSHMVLQLDMPVPIWGTADAGEEVTVSFAGQRKTTKADASGKWLLKLDPLTASAEPRVLTVSPKHQCTDVLVGEVWLGSGQSNMAGPVRTFKGNDPGLQKTLAAAPYPHVRMLKQGVPGWMESTPAQLRDPVWPNSVPAEGKLGYAGSETGDVIGHIAHAARLILQNEKLAAETVPDGDPHQFGNTYHERALRYVHDMDHTMVVFVMKWLVRADTLRLYQPDSPAYDAASRPNSSSKPMPWNQQMMVLNGVQRLAECHALLPGKDATARTKLYDAIVQSSIDWFFEKVQRITVNGHDCYCWTYAAEDPMVHIEDSAHGGYDVGGLCRAYTSGRYRLTAEMMRPFANTVLHIMRSPADGITFAGRVDGAASGKRPPGTLRGHWIDLCEFEPALLPLFHKANQGRIKSSADTTAYLLLQRHRLSQRAPTGTH